jgi:hypothetical protein
VRIFRGRIDGAQRQSMTSVGEVTAEEGREKFLCTQPESLMHEPMCEKRLASNSSFYKITLFDIGAWLYTQYQGFYAAERQR